MADDPTPQTYMTCNLCGDLVRFDKWGEHLQAHSSPAPPTEREEREPHREICALCHEVSRVGFHVPNDIWEKALHASQIHDIICLACFTRLADERGVAWDGDITFYPVSRVSHDSLRTPTPKQREEREDAARRLRAFIRKHAPGGCLRLSKGDHCRCPLCDVERLRTHSPSRGAEREDIATWVGGEAYRMGLSAEDAADLADMVSVRLRTHSPEEPVGWEKRWRSLRKVGVAEFNEHENQALLKTLADIETKIPIGQPLDGADYDG